MRAEALSRYGTGGVKQVYTTGQVAKICRCAPRTVTTWFDAGLIGGYLIPGAAKSKDRRIPREDLIRFLKAHGMPLNELEEDARYKVLLVGTDRVFDAAVRAALPESGYALSLALDGFDAGVSLVTIRPQTVVIDLSAAWHEGCSVAARVRQHDSAVLLIGLAGEDGGIAASSLAADGFNDIFQKPFEPALLAAKIAGAKVIADAPRGVRGKVIRPHRSKGA